MTNQEFQKIMLQELKSLKEDSNGFKKELKSLKDGQIEIKKELKAITEQTVDLTEFREKINAKLDTIIEENEILKELKCI